MTQISRGRANQFSDFMTVLKLRAIDFDNRPRIADEAFRCRLHQSGFTGPRRTQKKEISDRSAWAGHPRQVHLINVNYLLNCFVLTNDSLTEVYFELFGFISGLRRIQLLVEPSHGSPPSIGPESHERHFNLI